MSAGLHHIVWFSDPESSDVTQMGGKNASLGEMTRNMRQAGIPVPEGFAITAAGYWAFLDANGLRPKIAALLQDLKKEKITLGRAGRSIRALIATAKFPAEMEDAIKKAYQELSAKARRQNLDVAVRSSATAEDLPDASFAGQHETYLNVRGERDLLDACRRCFASLFKDRAIVYRETHHFEHMKVGLSVGVQRMVRSDLGSAGVMFSIDTDSGFPRTILIDAAWGLGEAVVQGQVDPDEYMIFKPLLAEPELHPIIEKNLGTKEEKIVYGGRGGSNPTRTVRTSSRERLSFVLKDEQILKLARWAVAIEEHYHRAMDIEWAKDGKTGELFIVQARPETVQSRREGAATKTYTLKGKGRRLVTGLSIGEAIASGKVCKLKSPAEIARFEKGAILVTATTDPDWMPIMKRAAAIVTDHGGRTSHAAIVSRELGLSAIVGTGNATSILHTGQTVTVSCAEGEAGYVYDGAIPFEVRDLAFDDIAQTHTKVMLNMANPAAALRWWRLPADGIGLARMEFIIGNIIKIHPMALVSFAKLKDPKARRQIAQLTRGYRDKSNYFVDKLAFGIAQIAASRYPDPVIVRLSDFKTNEYARLIGGAQFEPTEENPMLGWRGASRYYSDGYRKGFALECRAIRKVRDEIGLRNVIVMIPFCRTLDEADKTLQTMADYGLRRGHNELEVYVMCEIPSNVILAEKFAERFDGFSIGSNDLTQLTLGVDRDSERLAPLFDEQNEAVTTLISNVIRSAHKLRRKVGLCGEAPSNHPEFARFLVRAGIDSISVSPGSFDRVKRTVASAESEELATAAAK
ncbi:MAG: phosphoenolpyruvate synthase [Candidatus Binatus sp.]|uniref:phosphoenolpyruvate synthase n=1 Tax=Candidatus Binatus sp. TaxID=2811406 RepID=UPI00272273D9|nr:phosphoenolpyruvate synthase [Candidatus Binatus sp.]MDO8431003.1 phosphoenolpyruvate synthase [Candidatus Binatus sp.]